MSPLVQRPVCDRPYPPCSHHSDTEDDRAEVVRCTMLYALGACRSQENRRSFLTRVARLHDHRGTLYVVIRRGLPWTVISALREAWEQIGGQPGEMVTLVDEADPVWQAVWDFRAFGQEPAETIFSRYAGGAIA